MATDKKHIAVYLDPAVEQALIAFCEQNGMVSKKGFMYSAGVNAVLADFFGVSGNIPADATIINKGNTLIADNIPNQPSNTLAIDNIPVEHTQIEDLPGKLKA